MTKLTAKDLLPIATTKASGLTNRHKLSKVWLVFIFINKILWLAALMCKTTWQYIFKVTWSAVHTHNAYLSIHTLNKILLNTFGMWPDDAILLP
jgi:hypothetical protein